MKTGRRLAMILFAGWLLLGDGTGLKAATENEHWFSVSAGYGVPYGYMGLNLEANPLLPDRLHHVNNYFSFSMGLGYRHNAPLYAFGVNGYPLGRKGLLQPRLSFHYAKVDRVLDKLNFYEEDYDSIEALCAGAGLGLKLSDWLSLRAEVFYLFHVFDRVDIDTLEEIGGRFKLAFGAQLSLASDYRSQMTSEQQQGNPSFMQAGLGLGIPYGGIGINLEFSPLLPGGLGQVINNYSSLLAGSGFTTAGSAYSIGLRIYPMGKERLFRPRFGLHFGTVAIFKWWGGDSSNLEGIALSAGLLYKINSRWAVDGDLVYIASIFGWDQKDVDSVLKVSFGIRLLL